MTFLELRQKCYTFVGKIGCLYDKQNAYACSFAQPYFWRTRQQHEIDYIEEVNGQLHAFEFKWNERKANCKCPESFKTAYPDATFQVITPKNIEEFLTLNP